MRFPQSTLLRKWRKIKMIDFDAEVGGYVVADHFEPAELFGSEPSPPLTPALSLRARECLLFRHPLLEIVIYSLRKRDKFIVPVHGEAHERYKVSEDMRGACAFDL